jgi:hypothetical protein
VVGLEWDRDLRISTLAQIDETTHTNAEPHTFRLYGIRVIISEEGIMSRKLYFVAASLLFLSLVSCGLSLMPNSLQPGLPVNGSLGKTIGLVLMLAALVATLAGVLTAMFEQVERRSEARMRRELEEGLARIGRKNRRR